MLTIELSCMPDNFQTLQITVKYYASVYLNHVLIPRFVCRQLKNMVDICCYVLLQV